MKKKIKTIKFWIYDLTLDAVYFVQIGGKPSESVNHFLKRTERTFKDDESKEFFKSITRHDGVPQDGWCFTYGECPVVYIYLKYLGTNVAAHEAHHAVTHTLEVCKGIPQTRDTEEVYAYVRSWLTAEIVSNAYKKYEKMGVKL